jgi:hypothetical protein
MFCTDGSSHYTGVMNEEKTIEVMKKLGLLSDKTERLGGPRNKADWKDGDKLYSGKHKEHLSEGSFDWVNTTRLDDLWSPEVDSFLKNVEEWAKLPTRTKSHPNFLKQVREDFSKTSSFLLDSCSPETLKAFLLKNLVESNKNIQCVVTESSSRRIFIFPASEHPAVKLMERGYEPSLSGNASGSRKIVFTKDETTTGAGLRLRIACNNGVRAFLGLTTGQYGRTKKSYVVAKLQQDNVQQLVERSFAKVYNY